MPHQQQNLGRQMLMLASILSFTDCSSHYAVHNNQEKEPRHVAPLFKLGLDVKPFASLSLMFYSTLKTFLEQLYYPHNLLRDFAFLYDGP